MINIYELLKDCPVGTKLYCTLWGESIFTGINDGKIVLDYCTLLDAFGRWNKHGECVLFPSKEQRDWSKFKAPQPLPKAGELCWTMSSVGNWTPRYATGTTASNGMPIFFCNQSKKGESMTYVWRKWCDFKELINDK